MSASKQKKVRSSTFAEGVDKKAAAAREKEIKDRKFKRNTIIFVVALVIVVALAIVINSNLFYTGMDAVVIDGTGFNTAEVSFYYNAAVNTFYNNNYSYIGFMGLDLSKPLDEQPYLGMEDSGQTWAEYFYDYALDMMAQDTALYNAAMKAGYTLSAEDEAAIEENMDGFTAAALQYGYSDTDTYLGVAFGKGVDTELVRNLLTRQVIAGSYSETISDSFSYTADELKAYYSEHADELDIFTYQSYTVSTSGEAYAELETSEEKTAAAHEAAEKIAEAGTVDEFVAAVQEYVGKDKMLDYADAEATRSIAQGSEVAEACREWLVSAERKEGDTFVYDSETGSGSTVIMYVSRDNNEYNTVNMRHLLILAEADENGKYTDEALAEAKAAVEELYAKWQEDPTEENFIALVQENSEDTNTTSVAEGGLYEDIYHNYMVAEINDFLFSEGVKAGDTAICYGNNSNYAGYHIVYHCGENDELFCDMLAEAELRTNDYNAVLEELFAAVVTEEKLGDAFLQY